MKTPKEFADNLNNKIITKEMLLSCLYSVNKRAKNFRDKEKEYKQDWQWYYKYDNAYSTKMKKEEYYSYKEKLLSVLTPNCIHKEPAGYERIRLKSTDNYKEYIKHLKAGDYVWRNSYFDHEFCMEVDFVDIEDKNRPKYRYYLFYDIGGEHTFHTPTKEEEIKDYPQLEIVEIDTLDTHGKEITDLVSIQFVRKIIDLIQSGNYILALGDKNES